MLLILLRVGVMGFSFIVGVAASVFFNAYLSQESTLPPLTYSSTCPYLTELPSWRDAGVVISVLSDDEFYIGKTRVAASQINNTILNLLDGTCGDHRVVYIKSAPQVGFETVNLIVGKVKDAGVNRIEFVLDKKKRTSK